MYFDEYTEMARYIGKQKDRQFKNMLIAASLNAWQSGAGEKKTLGQYLNMFHLSVEENEQEPMTKEEKKETLARIDRNIAKIFKKVKKVKKVRDLKNAGTIQTRR